MNKYYILLISIAFSLININTVYSNNLPEKVLVGYWHNWDNPLAPMIGPEKVHPAYNVINIAFATPRAGTDYDIYFHPLIIKKDDFKSRIKSIQSQGKKVLLSIGGGNTTIKLDSAMERDVFVQSVLRLLFDYEFDGIDIDFEGNSIRISGGTISQPVDSCVILLIDAIKKIMREYSEVFGKNAILSISPETAYVQGGQSGFGGVWGAYLPILDALRDSIDLVNVQLYNSGGMYGLDWKVYCQATPDFIVAMTEKLIKGFNTKGGFFQGFPPTKITIGLPACNFAASGGYMHPDSVLMAMNYLLGKSDYYTGSYVLLEKNGYPNIRGMMTWSINWDATDSCTYPYEFAVNFLRIFNSQTNIPGDDTKIIASNKKELYFDLFPNPARTEIVIKLPEFCQNLLPLEYYVRNIYGSTVEKGIIRSLNSVINISKYPRDVYFISIDDYTEKFIKD
ncbi:MAG TPA: glycosyl hydrolase family 18 protein [Candidatus Kapabacteria bacterium]|mgnify:FL=1|nr:glycosyl hydrolase family 18 protein [Candidatus Kapabacteria bacterium]